MATAPPTIASDRAEHHAKHKHELRRVPFADLVRIHFHWREVMRSESGFSEAERTLVDDEYQAVCERFEAEHGEIVTSYWCANVESAVALTKGPPPRGRFRRRRSAGPRFHRVSDWATKNEPEIARALHKCDELAIRISEMLRGRSRTICMQLVMTSACHLLSLVDSRDSTPQSARDLKAALTAEQRELANVARDYREAANGDAQLIYFAGMGVGIATLGMLYALGGSILQRPEVPASTIVGCLVAGALGAIVSVIARVNSGSFALDADVDRGYTLFLGALRPWIGSIFGLLTYFAVTSGFVEIFKVPGEGISQFYFLCVIAFAAGFSERWAQDTLTGGLTGQGRSRDKPQPARPKPEPVEAGRGAAPERSPTLEGGGAVTPAAHE
jgi:hypothetical protein